MTAPGAAAYTILHVGADQLDEVKALDVAASDGPHWQEGVWARFLEHATGTGHHVALWGAWSAETQLAGWLAGSQLGESAEVEFVWVRPKDRGCGVAKLLLQTWMQWAKDLGAREGFLEVRAGNAAAHALYRSAGFLTIASRPGYYSQPAEDADVMRVAL